MPEKERTRQPAETEKDRKTFLENPPPSRENGAVSQTPHVESPHLVALPSTESSQVESTHPGPIRWNFFPTDRTGGKFGLACFVPAEGVRGSGFRHEFLEFFLESSLSDSRTLGKLARSKLGPVPFHAVGTESQDMPDMARTLEDVMKAGRFSRGPGGADSGPLLARLVFAYVGVIIPQTEWSY